MYQKLSEANFRDGSLEAHLGLGAAIPLGADAETGAPDEAAEPAPKGCFSGRPWSQLWGSGEQMSFDEVQASSS